MKSMTGFGRANEDIDGREYGIEIKSVNHKYSDITVKMPKSISYLEEKVRNVIANKISRGKIDIYINFFNYSEKGKNIRINHEIAKMYIKQLKVLAEETGINASNIYATEITKYPEVLTIENAEDEELIWSELSSVLNIALENFVSMRKKEGIKIKEDLEERIKVLQGKAEEVSKYSSGLVEEYIVKLETRLKDLLKTDVVDETRLAQEVVIYSDKCSIEEELTRLKSHFAQFNDLLNKNEAIGKRLDFLIQEINREINTIGSKANSLNITNSVIDMKTELENIREQVQNIE